MKSIITVLTSYLLVSSNVIAIDKHIHPHITQDTIKQYNACAQRHKLSPITVNEALLISEQTLKEDDASIDRACNWHFYDSYRVKGDIDNALPEKKSLHRVFNRRSSTLTKALATEGCVMRFFSASGSLLHYLQDMGVPAHVAPNYHAKPDSWFESLLVEAEPDPIDGLLHPAFSGYSISDKTCDDLYLDVKEKKNEFTTPVSFFNALLNELADKTRQAVNSTTLPSTSRSFEYEFWTLRTSRHKDFAPYGFKDERNRFNLDAPPCNLEENRSTCKNFVAKQYKNTVHTGIKALIYIAALKKQHNLNYDPAISDPFECFYLHKNK